MGKQKFSLKSAEKVRQTTTMEMQKNIRKMYEQLYQDVTKKIGQFGNRNIQKQNLILLQRDIKNRIEQLNKDIKNGIIQDMRIVSNEVVEDTRTFLKRYGFKEEDIHEAFRYVPQQIINNIINGNVYQDGWTLSGAIWGYNKQIHGKLNKIISIGTAQGKSALDIAKDLEQYVNPSAKKQTKTIYSWRIDKYGNKIKDSVYFGKIDYNALRLARTLLSHAYQQSFETVNRNDPFVIGYRWLNSNFHGRVCDICRARAETDQFGLGIGVFPKDQLPLDHPNGMCTFEAVIPNSMNEIAKRIGEWYNNPVGTFPDIDKYAKDFIK